MMTPKRLEEMAEELRLATESLNRAIQDGSPTIRERRREVDLLEERQRKAVSDYLADRG